MCLDLDLTDIIIAEDRLADFNDMLDLTNANWNEKRPVEELQNIVSTARYIYSLLIKELQEITARKDDRIFEICQNLKKEEERNTLTAADIAWELEFLRRVLDSEENLEYFKAHGHGFAEGHAAEDVRILGGIITGFGAGCAYEKTAAGKGEEAKDFLVRFIAKHKEWMPAGGAAAEQRAEVSQAGASAEAAPLDAAAV